MKKAILATIGIWLVLLLGCAAPAPTPTPMPEPTPTAAPITTAEELLGVWERLGGATFMEFREDGTYRVAGAAEPLEEHPAIEGDFWFEEGQLFLKDIAGVDNWDDCVGLPAGSYQVQGAVKDYLVFVAIDEPCEFREIGVTTMPYRWSSP